MWSEFFKATGGKLAERGLGVGSASLVYWAGLAALWVTANGEHGLISDAAAWLGGQSGIVQLAVLLGGVLAVAVPGVVVSRLTAPMLRLLEGYWPSWAGRLRKMRVDAMKTQLAADLEAWQELQSAAMRGEQLSPKESSKHVELDRHLHRRPGNPEHLMPTRTGNILRAAEDRPRVRYGLDSVIVWPRLWLVLPESARQELASARGSLDGAVSGVVWALSFAISGLLLLGFSPSGAWPLGYVAFGLGAGVAVLLAVWWVPMRAMVFGDLVESGFDLYRFGLYEQLRWPTPTHPETEQPLGQDLTVYLWRGELPESSTPVGFTTPRARG